MVVMSAFKKHIPLVAVLTAILISCTSKVEVSGTIEGLPQGMFPDYSDVTVPCNIAPLDFEISGDGNALLTITSSSSNMTVKTGKGTFRIPMRRWKRLLMDARGSALEFTVSVRQEGKWLSYTPFRVNVSEDEADPYVVYRLIAPGYGLWNKMGLYQRNITSFKQTPVYENRLTDYNCVNCHSFRMQDP
ncbi:MAG: hypothetical protein IJJ96_06780, partial [Bacteroidales bacterium]|nr:hypothetical protein [Bacteroidales bacterium]